MQFCRYSRMTSACDLPSFHHFSPKGSRSVIGGCSSSCFEYNTGQVETGALSGFSRTAMHDLFEIRIGQHSSTGRTKRLAYQHLNVFFSGKFLCYSQTIKILYSVSHDVHNSTNHPSLHPLMPSCSACLYVHIFISLCR